MSRIPRIYVGERLEEGIQIRPDERAERHLVKVLRLRSDDVLMVFDGQGNEHHAALSARAGQVMLQIGEPAPTIPEPDLDICLVQGISRGERMDLVVQKSTELGVRQFRPVFTRRSIVRLDEKRARRRAEHWRAVMISACEQCGRATLPVLHPPTDLERALRDLAPGTTRLMLDAHTGELALSPPTTDRLVLLIGPEGGLTREEKEMAAAGEFRPIRLGPRIMRTETAALAAISFAQTVWGDFSASR
ncbi:MAG: 16S rRNA (uracil(1498)-N(3))-methyltransferase [Gammaproteobacteria bacterium]